MNRDRIAELIPHQGRMCLLDSLVDWSPDGVHCRAIGHGDAGHPLRTASGLLSPAGVEIAAQAMALHGALLAARDATPMPGYLAAVRGVRLHVARLDGVQGALQVRATRLAGDGKLASYRFDISDEDGRPLVDGRATVVLDSPLPAARAHA